METRMPSIPLDTKHWTKVAPGPEDESITVTARGFACYYSNEATPPEKASGGTELAEGSALTYENTSGRWFRAKEPASTEAPNQPSILEVTQAPAVEGETISTAQIDNLAITTAKLAADSVTEPKIGSEAIDEDSIKAEAVTEAKVAKETLGAGTTKPATLPAVAAEKLVKVGASGGDRVVLFNLTGDGGTTLKYKVKHSLKTQSVAVTYQTNSAGKPSEQITVPPKTVAINENEIEATFSAGNPAAGETIWGRIEG